MELVNFFLEKGAEFAKDNYDTSLGYAFACKDPVKRLAMVSFLLEHGVDVHEELGFQGAFVSPLKKAQQFGDGALIQLLTDRGAHI